MSSSMQRPLSSLQPGINDICDVAVGAVPKGGPLWESRKSVASGWWLVVRSPHCRSATCVKNNIVYILCKDILYTLCKHIVYKFLLIEALIFLLNEDRCESDKPVSSGILAYLRQSSR